MQIVNKNILFAYHLFIVFRECVSVVYLDYLRDSNNFLKRTKTNIPPKKTNIILQIQAFPGLQMGLRLNAKHI